MQASTSANAITAASNRAGHALETLRIGTYLGLLHHWLYERIIGQYQDSHDDLNDGMLNAAWNRHMRNT
jgi:hypothetical protein